MRTPVLALPLATVALVAAGCGSGETAAQAAARNAVTGHVRALDGYDSEDVHCTRNPRPWFVEQPTSVYICTVERDDGDCDWFRVTVERGVPTVTLESRRAGCVLPL